MNKHKSPMKLSEVNKITPAPAKPLGKPLWKIAQEIPPPESPNVLQLEARELKLQAAKRLLEEGQDKEQVRQFLEAIEPLATRAASLTLLALTGRPRQEQVEVLYDALVETADNLEDVIQNS